MSQPTVAECPAHHGYEPFAQKNPFPAYAALRAEEPVMYDERIGYWVITRYDDVKAVFDDWSTFSSENAQAPVRERGAEAKRIMEEGGFTAYSGLSARVPPDHTRIRKIVARAFSPRRYKALEPAIRAHVVRLVEAMLQSGDRTGDLVADLAYELPTVTILTLIGADPTRVDTFKRFSDSRGAMTWGHLSDEEQIPHAHNLVEYWQECLRIVAEAHTTYPDSLVGDLVRAQEAGDEISDHEIASVCYSLLFAGHETTTTLIANALRELLARPDQWRRVVAEPALARPAVDEVLRFSPSIVAWRRRATRDAVVGGVAIPAGADLLLVMGAANRDESRFGDPEEFDLARPNAREHLAFGYGIHYCLGNMLAKMQVRVAIEEVTRLAPGLRLLDAQAIEFRDNLSFRIPARVPVTWDADVPDIVFFDDAVEPDIAVLGGKAASLVTMTAAGMPVPPGFVVTTAVFDVAFRGLRAAVDAELDGVDRGDMTAVDAAAARIRRLIRALDIPGGERIGAAYAALEERFGAGVPVAVRSSATAEDLPGASFAGQQDTYLWIRGRDAVLEHVRRCWASLFTCRAILYRFHNGIPDDGLSMAVAVQKMVAARVAGVAITLNPTTGDRSKVTIDASYGLGELVVAGRVTPDNILLDKVMRCVVAETIGAKHAELVPDAATGRLVEREVDEQRRRRRCLTQDELVAITNMARVAEKHYGCPQDIEWALDGPDLFLLQARPETVHSPRADRTRR